MASRKKTRFDFQSMKDQGENVVYLSCYDYLTASLAESESRLDSA